MHYQLGKALERRTKNSNIKRKKIKTIADCEKGLVESNAFVKKMNIILEMIMILDTIINYF